VLGAVLRDASTGVRYDNTGRIDEAIILCEEVAEYMDIVGEFGVLCMSSRW
jgi:hypothetical protein